LIIAISSDPRLIGPGSRPPSDLRSAATHPWDRERTGTPRRQGRAVNRRGQHPTARLKEKLPEHPGKPSTWPTLTRPRIARPGYPRNTSNSYAARRSGSRDYCFGWPLAHSLHGQPRCVQSANAGAKHLYFFS